MKFSDFRKLKEADDNKTGVTTKITLGDGNDYKPFFVSDNASSEHAGKNSSIAPIIRAFKNGAIWGWTKDKESGEQKPVKIGGKKLYLAGGAVRDILKGKTPRNFELVTDATPSEIKKILRQNGFNDSESGDNSFKIKESNKKGEPFMFEISVKGNKFELSPFRKNMTGDYEHGTHAEDARRRDLTINSMYLALTNDDGPNKEIVDFHGGIHDLTGGKMKFIGGDTANKLKESPMRALRVARMANRYGTGRNSISDTDRDAIRGASTLLTRLNMDELQDEFYKALENEDVDQREYLNTCDDLGLLDCVFPNTRLNKNFPKELVDLHDAKMSLAWLLKDSDSHSRKKVKDSNKVDFLADLLNAEPSWLDADGLDALMRKFLKSGLTNRDVLKSTTKLGGKKPYLVKALIKHISGPRVKVFKIGKDGVKSVDDMFADLISPFTGTPTEETLPEINERKKHMELNNFLSILRELTPRNM